MIKEAEIKENSIENVFCEKFSKLQQHPMDFVHTKLLASILINSLKNIKLEEEEKPFLFKLIEKRLSVLYDYNLTNDVILWLSYLSANPAIAVMYLTYLQYWSAKNNIDTIDIDQFCHIFPDGYPSNDDLHKLWDEQKILDNKTFQDNLLDRPNALISIKKIKN